MEVQSVLIDKKYLSRKKAEEWIKKNNYKLKKIDITDNLYRFRQLDPKLFNQKSFRIKVIKETKKGRMVMLVVGNRKKKSK